MRRAFLLLALLPLPALAQEASPPDLVGTWTGTFQAILVGATPYRPSEGTGASFADTEIPYTVEFTEQKGGRLAGTISAGDHTETLIGALMPPEYTSGTLVDDDGSYRFSVRDAATIDFCYGHNLPDSRAVACGTVTRQ
jgi:hypothetical protein